MCDFFHRSRSSHTLCKFRLFVYCFRPREEMIMRRRAILAFAALSVAAFRIPSFSVSCFSPAYRGIQIHIISFTDTRKNIMYWSEVSEHFLGTEPGIFQNAYFGTMVLYNTLINLE